MPAATGPIISPVQSSSDLLTGQGGKLVQSLAEFAAKQGEQLHLQGIVEQGIKLVQNLHGPGET